MSYQLEMGCDQPGWSSVSFVRPVHGLVALHGSDVVPVSLLGLPFGRCAVLCHDRRHASDLERILRHKHGLPIRLVDPETLDPDSAEIKLTTLHSGKGLEFAIVAIARLAAGSFPYDLSRRPAEEHDELLAQQRRLLYVGCTRATHALLVSAAREEPSQFTELLQEPLWQHVLA
jgi:superfamily I DNA/RNA helicase